MIDLLKIEILRDEEGNCVDMGKGEGEVSDFDGAVTSSRCLILVCVLDSYGRWGHGNKRAYLYFLLIKISRYCGREWRERKILVPNQKIIQVVKISSETIYKFCYYQI